MAGQRNKRGGRRVRLEQRAARPVLDPCPHGQVGGLYKPLTEAEIRGVYGTALDLLEKLGMGEVPPRLRTDLLAAGAKDNDAGRVTFPPRLVEEAVDQAARTFVLHGRDESRSIEVGGNRVHFGTGGAAVQTLDLDTVSTGPLRSETCTISPGFRTRWPMSAGLPAVVWQRMCRTVSISTSTRSMHCSGTRPNRQRRRSHWPNTWPRSLKCWTLPQAGKASFSRRPFVKAHISPVISPMRYGEDAVDVVYECIRHNIPDVLHHRGPGRSNRAGNTGRVSFAIRGRNACEPGHGPCDPARISHGVFQLAAGRRSADGRVFRRQAVKLPS